MCTPKGSQIKIGDEFGRWTVIGDRFYTGHRTSRLTFWPCRCSCPAKTERPVQVSQLLSGGSRSCGCLALELRSARMRTHGLSKERLFGIWTKMLRRCANPKDDAYRLYGARGIVVCEEWKDYMAFRTWALANGYADDLSIDRINGDSNYEPGNCRWADKKTQAANTSKRRSLTAFGETKSLTEWTTDSRCQVGVGTLWARIKRGQSVEDAISSPKRDSQGYKREAAALMRETGEVLPGVEIVAERESVSIKFGKGKGNGENAAE